MPRQLTEVSVSSLPADQRTCAICQDSLGGREGGGPVKTQCNHFFDHNCIMRWLDGGNSTCPICREEVRGGGGLSDRFRGTSRSFRHARERDAEDREQMQQAQADYGGDSELDDSESDNDSPVWENYDAELFDRPAPIMRYAPRSFSAPSRYNDRYNDSPNLGRASMIPSSIQRAQSHYNSALSDIEEIDARLCRQAQVSHRANQAHHQAERNIQEAFARLIAARRSNDRHEIEIAIAIQESVTPLLYGATRASEHEATLLEDLMEERLRADEMLKYAREHFILERDMVMLDIEVSLDY